MNIGEIQRTLSLKAERKPDYKFENLYDLLYDEYWLRLAHDHVAQNAGSVTAGCDGIDMTAFDEELERNLQQLAQELKAETFEPYPVRRVFIPKPNGKVRPLGIPSIRDRIVQEAARMILEPIYEAGFSQYSFGFRPNRCTMDAIKCITWSTQEHKKYFWVIEGDISSYFDTINHKKLLKLLMRRIKDRKILRLIWKFLRAGVMEKKLFRDTKLGTPQGGIISPLLANIYLHELDRYMKRYTDIPQKGKTERRRQGQANYVYVRYADDFVVLANGRREEAEGLKEELCTFLKESLSLTLSKDKTKITHLNDGVKFLGFEVIRKPGHDGMKTKVLIPVKAMEQITDKVTRTTDKTSHQDSIDTKIQALNRLIGGWCRYYQYTSKASSTFNKIEHITFWSLAHWIGRKGQLNIPAVIRRYGHSGALGSTKYQLIRAGQEIPTRHYKKRFLKPNPFTTQEKIQREELPTETSWTGWEARPGMADLRPAAMARDNYRCQRCDEPVSPYEAQVDHKRPVRRFKRPVDANSLKNLQTLCIPCHKAKTKEDRQRESRVR
jgi:RNA-directed DNA polymerase